MRRWLQKSASVMVALAAAVAAPSRAAPAADFAARPPQDETIYFLLPDRFWNGDPANDHGGPPLGRLKDGFDPADAGFYQGGDLKGVTAHLDYIQRLGATAIWVGPIFRNRWVQGRAGHESAGYHGYWITDFTDVDPHLGTRADFKALVDAAHARGMKVILDIVLNHTADVIHYRECPQAPCPYRSEADFPFTRRGGVEGAPINAGFAGDGPDGLTADNFAKLTRPDFAYTPYVDPGDEHLKKPDWLNDPLNYHNRGDMPQKGSAEAMTHGDFSGLDDVATEQPRVVQGFIDVYARWIADFGIDGYRIDTARHVDPQLWQAFVPAILDFARAHGRPNFHIFGEVFDGDPGVLARHTRVDQLPAVLDFGFHFAALDVLSGKAGPERLARIFDADPDYANGEATAAVLPTFLDNHDTGRLGWLIQKRLPQISRDELMKRVELGHALMLFSRGVPVIYSGDEQGLVGLGDDRGSREPLFPSHVAAYQAERPLGSDHAGAPGLDTQAPMFRALEAMIALRNAHPGLRHGVQEVRIAGETPGLLVFTRTDPDDGQYVVALNTSAQAQSARTVVGARYVRWTALHGACAPASAAPGSLRVEVPALGWIVCRSEGAR
jgi:neopullulanase